MPSPDQRPSRQITIDAPGMPGIQRLAPVEAAVILQRHKASEYGQKAVDRAREVAEVIGGSVQIFHASDEGFFVGNLGPTSSRTDPPAAALKNHGDILNGNTDGTRATRKKAKQPKVGKPHDMRGLNGFYKGVFYRNGESQHSKR